MSLGSELKKFWRAFRSDNGASAPKHSGHSLARAMKESTQIKGGGNSAGAPRGSTEAHEQLVAKGHKRYNKSFKSRD